MLTAADFDAIVLTLKLSTVTTVILLLLATPLAWWLNSTASRIKPAVLALCNLPLVLPPTVLGFYLLVMLGPDSWVGQATQAMGWGLLSFSFTGLVVGSVVFSFPFAVQPILYAFESIGRRPLEVAATLGAKPLDVFLSVGLPLARPGLITAAVLSFAHTVGEFGVVLMLGGNIPGSTQVVSTQIYNHVESLAFDKAHTLALLMVGFSFVVLLWLTARRQQRRNPVA